ncbi:hypothetical protein HOY82DRAFT_138621 [Tuber indicum]|nr:hypothetical protein HOY82DRAFT_138621 [Tuber indicum]
MTFRRNHFDKTVRLGHMTNVIVVTNPDYRLAPVYHYSLFTLQVIGNFYIYIFFLLGVSHFGHCKHGEWSSFFFSVFFPPTSFLFFLFFFTFSSLGYIFFLFFFLAWIS